MDTITSSELRDYATVIAATVAVLVFIVNTYSQGRTRRLDNLARFNQAHQRLFDRDTYLTLNLTDIESGQIKRDLSDAAMERRFHLLLLEIERLAILANNKAVPRATQVYMFGSYAPRILELLNEAERGSMFWELAVGYLEGIATDSRRYAELTSRERERFWR